MFEIDKEKCIHCGLCVKDCSPKALQFNDEKIPVIDEKKCFKCQHCLAVLLFQDLFAQYNLCLFV